MYLSKLKAQNFRRFGSGEHALEIEFAKGLTALVGRNDSGKTAIIDALRYVLLTRDQAYLRVHPSDFHVSSEGDVADEVQISCHFSDLTESDKAAFVEFLSYVDSKPVLQITWTARRKSSGQPARHWVDISLRAGLDATGPTLDQSARDLLAAAYLRPLRDAAREMSPGQGSRLSQILANVDAIRLGDDFDPDTPPSTSKDVEQLSLLGLGDSSTEASGGAPGGSRAQRSVSVPALLPLGRTPWGDQPQAEYECGSPPSASTRTTRAGPCEFPLEGGERWPSRAGFK